MSSVCADTDECTTGGHNCDSNAVCINIEGSFTCVCKDGYTGDGITCTSELCMYIGLGRGPEGRGPEGRI